MKSAVRIVGLLAAAVLLAGCLVRIGGEGSKPAEDGAHSPPPVVVVPSDPADSVVFAEIDAARKLSFEASRLSTLKAVAARPSLSPPAQVHLVNTALRVLDFEASRLDVLLTVIANPAFAPAAKEAILRQLERLEFEASKTQVLNAIQQRSGA